MRWSLEKPALGFGESFPGDTYGSAAEFTAKSVDFLLLGRHRHDESERIYPVLRSVVVSIPPTIVPNRASTRDHCRYPDDQSF